MKKLIKLILTLVIIVVLIIVVPLVILFITIQDSTDKAPTELYKETITFENQIDSLLDRFTENKDDDFYLSFNEEEVNLLIFALIKEKVNNNYYVTNNDASIKAENVPSNIPVIGGREVKIKHAYIQMEDKDIFVYITMDAAGMKTNLNVGFNFDSTGDVYKITLNKLGLGGLNLMSGFGKMFLKPVLSAIGFSEESINQDIQTNNLPVEFNIDDFSFTFEKKDLGELIKAQLPKDNASMEAIGQLVDLLAAPDNGLLDIGVFKVDDKPRFGLKLGLKEIKNSNEDSTKLNNSITAASSGFDVNTFVANKTQTFLISNLTGGTPKITFTNLDFNRIVYTNTDGYQDFKYPNPSGGDIFKVTGILFDFKTTTVDLIFVVVINGVESKITLTGDITSADNDKKMIITLKDKMKLQNIETSSAIILDILSKQSNNVGGMSYDKDTNSFVLSVDTFNNFMVTGGENANQSLNINKIKATNGGIEIYVELDEALDNTLIETLTNALENLLNTGGIDTSGLDANNPAVEALNDVLQNIENNGITEELTNELIHSLNELDPADQEKLLDEIKGDLPPELEDLYNSLFGK